MSRFTAGAASFARTCSGLILSIVISQLSTSFLSAATTSAPQLLPYTINIVAGGGPYGANVTSSTNPNKYTVGNACGTNAASPPAGTLVALDTAGDGCLATQVGFYEILNAVADSEGNLFIADYYNKLIRRVDAHTGIITAYAGTTLLSAAGPAQGQPCASGSSLTSSDANGDGCPATDVFLPYPKFVALDAEGNVWYSDKTVNAVRKISKSTGLISTIVNTSFTLTGNNTTMMTPGTNTVPGSIVTTANAVIGSPFGLAFDRQGNLYIDDESNELIDVVNLGTTRTTVAGIYTVQPQEILTIAGSVGSTSSSNGTTPFLSSGATFYNPYQLAVDNAGNIYIADEYKYNVRMINGSTGVISTFAGNGTGTTWTETTSANYIKDNLATSTNIENMYGVAVDSLGNVYIANYVTTGITGLASGSIGWQNGISRVDHATGHIYMVAGQITSSLSPQSLPGVEPTSEAGATLCPGATHAVGSGTLPDVLGDGCPGTQATIAKPYFVTTDATGNVYVGDTYGNLMREVSVGTQFPATAVGTPVTQYIEVNFGANDTPSATGAYKLPAGFTEFSLGAPSCGSANTDGTMNCVLSVTFTPAQAGIRTAPLTVTSAGGLVSNFSLTGTGLAPALAVDPGTQVTLATGLTAVNSIALDNAGNAYSGVPGSSTITTVSSSGTVSNLGSSLTGANAVAVDAAGNLYAALSSGSVVEVPGNGGPQITLGSGFTTPSGIAVDSFGNVYVADKGAESVSEIIAGTGTQIVLANQTMVPTLSGPTGLAVDTYGNIFVSNTAADDIIEIPFNGSGAVTLGSGLAVPIGLAVDPAGSLYVADSGNRRVVFIPNEGGTLNTADQISIITNAQLVTPLGTPSGVAVSGNGTVYVADSQNNAIYAFTRNAASFNFGGVSISSPPPSVPVDIISMGTEAATFNTSFWTESAGGSAYFSLSPSSIPSSSYFPDSGYGVSLTANFTPLAVQSGLSAVYTFNATGVTPPMLTLTGTAQLMGNNSSSTTITSTPPAGQTSWNYGQTVVVNVAVTVGQGLPTPTGTVTVTVGKATYLVTLTGGAGSVQITGLSAGQNIFNASYSGDDNSTASSAPSLNLTLANAPLTVTVNNLSKSFDAPLPPLTGVLSGVVNNDQIGVNYSTTASAASPAGNYPITASVTGSAASNYTVAYVPGTLTINQDSSVTTLGTSSTSVNNATQVTLTATVSNLISYAIVTAPTGNVTFYNGSTPIGTSLLNSSGVATLVVTFPVVGPAPSSNNVVTAVYTGDSEYLTSTAAALTIVSGTPTVTLTPATTNTFLTVLPGESGLTSFTLVPNFGYNGTIAFSCSGSPSPVTCSFSPPSVVANGTATSTTVNLTINTQASVNTSSSNQGKPGIAGSGRLPLSLAAIPGLLLLCGFSGRRRRLLRGYRFLLLFALCLIGLGFSGCGGSKITPGTPAGADTVTVVATGTGGSFASITQQFTITLNVQ
jgi:sugar lactone lactonase YvrE